jgi:tRNA threonylcarbamoyladenosine biosynthesis protein TsaB
VAVNVLAFATSTAVCSVAVVTDDRPVAVAAFPHGMRLLERLMSVVDGVLERSERTLSQMDLLAVDTGPGSFTGMRIGVMTAKTLAWALDKSVVGVSALRCLASGEYPGPVAAFIRARPGMLYWQAFDLYRNPLTEPAIESPPSIALAMEHLCEDTPFAIAADPELDLTPVLDSSEVLASRVVRMSVSFDAVCVAKLATPLAAGGVLSDAMHLNPTYVAEPLIGPPPTKPRESRQ